MVLIESRGNIIQRTRSIGHLCVTEPHIQQQCNVSFFSDTVFTLLHRYVSAAPLENTVKHGQHPCCSFAYMQRSQAVNPALTVQCVLGYFWLTDLQLLQLKWLQELGMSILLHMAVLCILWYRAESYFVMYVRCWFKEIPYIFVIYTLCQKCHLKKQ